MAGYEPEILEGTAGVSVTGSGRVVIAGGGTGIAPFRFETVLVDQFTTQSNAGDTVPPGAFVDLLNISPVLVTAPGNLLFDFTSAIDAQPLVDMTGQFFGADLRFLWDGVALANYTYLEVDVNIGVSTFTNAASMRALVSALPGSHTLAVQWGPFSQGGQAILLACFANTATLIVQGVP